MNARMIARFIATLILALLITIGYESTVSSRHKRGREAFLRAQAERFDRFYAAPDARRLVSAAISSVIVSGLFVGVYELLTFGVYRAICLTQRSGDEIERT